MNIGKKIPGGVRGLLRTIGRLADERQIQAYAVGGCVRDWCLGLQRVTDVDVAVEGDGIAMARAIAHRLHGAVETHEQFGTATICGRGPRGMRVDVASCRREVYARPAAYPRVSAGTLEDDLFRRDFTINAMAVRLDPDRFGMLIDPFQGLRDPRGRLLRMLHERSFLDDPSRILRGVRFAVRFHLRWERGTADALRRAVAAGALGRLNAGRLSKELARMLDEPDPRACLVQLASLLGTYWSSACCKWICTFPERGRSRTSDRS
jgi:tRNA nucleotidyltransferase (CCA-adding enzyme)